MMNSTDIGKILQKGYYISLGLASTLWEVAQDPLKRQDRIRDLDRFGEELAEKGVTTEAEARSYVDEVVARQVRNEPQPEVDSYPTTVSTVATPVNDPPQSELVELTRQIASLRAELEQLRGN